MTKPKLIFDATILNMYIFITVALKISFGFVTYGVREDTFGICKIWVLGRAAEGLEPGLVQQLAHSDVRDFRDGQ